MCVVKERERDLIVKKTWELQTLFFFCFLNKNQTAQRRQIVQTKNTILKSVQKKKGGLHVKIELIFFSFVYKYFCQLEKKNQMVFFFTFWWVAGLNA